jgi:hypothetical protein
MNANGSKLQKAFAVSSNAADSPITPERERVLFRKIARLIWDACGADWQAQPAGNETAAAVDAPAAALVQTNLSGNHSHVNQSIASMPVMDRPVVEKRDRE